MLDSHKSSLNQTLIVYIFKKLSIKMNQITFVGWCNCGLIIALPPFCQPYGKNLTTEPKPLTYLAGLGNSGPGIMDEESYGCYPAIVRV